MEKPKCPYCNSETICTIDNESLDNSSFKRAEDSLNKEDIFLDLHIFAKSKCFDCFREFTLEGTIIWLQPKKD